MANADFSAIAALCAKGNSVGMGRTIHIAPDISVASIGAPTAKVVTTLTMETGKVFTALATSNEVSKRTWQLESLGDRDSGGYRVTATYFIPKVDATRVDALDGPCAIIAVLPDLNGNKRIVGAKDNPASFTYAEAIDGDQNGITIVITWEGGDVPYFFDGSVPVTV